MMKTETELAEPSIETGAPPTPGNKSAPSRKMLWTGRILSALPVPLFLFSAFMKFQKPAEVIQGFNHLGIPERLAFGLGVLELTCTVLYAIPRTAALGAILLTGYLGGAILTHLRVGESFTTHIILGIIIWGGLFLRDPRVRALIPIRSAPSR